MVIVARNAQAGNNPDIVANGVNCSPMAEKWAGTGK
jgi:hypothetical protein